MLKQTCKEYQDKDISTMLRHLGSTFMNHRELSAQEAAYRILSIPYKHLSRQVVWVCTNAKTTRTAVLKTQKELEGKDDQDEDIFQCSILVRYASRPDCLQDMCLASFAANYTVSLKQCDEDIDDSVPRELDVDGSSDEISNRNTMPQHIKLKDGNGQMHKRRREAVIRFCKFSVEKDSTNHYRAKLMLYLPWRVEETDLIGNYADFLSHYCAVADIIHENEKKFTDNLGLIDDAIHSNAVNGPPEHVWANIAPEAEHANMQDKDEGVEVERVIEQEGLDANAAMVQRGSCDNACDLAAWYKAETEKTLIVPAEYRKMMRSLNAKQRQIVCYHRKWCKDAVIAIKQNRPVIPYRLFLSGPGGVGKTHVIRLIHSDTQKLLPLSGAIKPTDVTTLLTAPTGVAAFNIGGMTVHSALLLRVTKYGKGGEPLTFDKLNTLRSKLENLHLVVIDEISMVGSDMLLNIHRRLDEIKGVSEDSVLFGNVCILAVGDLYQLPPVCQSQIYQHVRNSVAALDGSLWKDHFRFHELTEVMRQKDDQEFAELLCRVRVGAHTKNDIELLRSRQTSTNDRNYPDDALHVFAYHKDVDARNNKKLYQLAPVAEQRTSIPASDDKTDSTGLVDLQTTGTKRKRSQTAGLHTILVLAVGARVMLLYNVNTSDGLVNGVIGTVEAIIKNNAGIVTTILVKFDNTKVGEAAIISSRWRQEFPHGVPIVRHEGQYEKAGKKGAQISRRQFPLTLAWAVTIHKCQGLTMDQIVVSMKGANRFDNGQAYVAFSRVKTLQGLYITDFDEVGIKAKKDISHEMNEMRQNQICVPEQPRLLDLLKPEWITVGHLNIRYFLEKVNDLQSHLEYNIYSKTDVMCFTETYLTKEHNIDPFLEACDYVSFRQDVPSLQNHEDKHGIMLCASAGLNPMELQAVSIPGLEAKVVVLNAQKSRLVVAVVYRKPSHPMLHFLQLLRSLLALMPLHVPTVVLGDFNDNIFGKQSSLLTSLMEEHRFKQFVTLPTTDSGSLLDHIYFNRHGPSRHGDVHIDVHDVYYSDHDSIFLSINCV